MRLHLRLKAAAAAPQRTSQRSASLKSAPATPGISPGGRHFRAAEFELAALLPLCDEVTSYVDALAAAAGSRSKTAALVETLDGRLTSLRHASMAVPTVDMDTAAQQVRLWSMRPLGTGAPQATGAPRRRRPFVFGHRLTDAALLRPRTAARASCCAASCGRLLTSCSAP